MKNLLFCIVYFCLSSLFAQNHIDLVNVYWRTSLNNSIEDSPYRRNFNTFVADVKLPFVRDERNILVTGFEYQYNTINLIDSKKPFYFDHYEFSAITLQLGWEYKWSNRSKLLCLGVGRLNTDYRNVTLSHFQLGALALGTTERSDNFDWKYGIYYNTEFFGPMVVPLFGFNWEINKKWRLKTVVPVNLELSYHPNSWFNTGLRFDGVNGSYRVMLQNPILSDPELHIDKADNNIWLFTEFNLGKNIWFHIKGGHSVLRKYRLYENNEKLALKLGPVNIGDDRPESIPLFKNGWSAEFRFIYRLPLN